MSMAIVATIQGEPETVAETFVCLLACLFAWLVGLHTRIAGQTVCMSMAAQHPRYQVKISQVRSQELRALLHFCYVHTYASAASMQNAIVRKFSIQTELGALFKTCMK